MSKARESPTKATGPTFEKLALSIRDIHQDLSAQAGRAVKLSLTLRNWIIGCYIAEYEQRGADRVQDGKNLLAKLSGRLTELGVSRTEERELHRYRQFYQTYPWIREALTLELRNHLADTPDTPRGSDLGVGDSQNRPDREGFDHPAVI
jgi:hypothetical protein